VNTFAIENEILTSPIHLVVKDALTHLTDTRIAEQVDHAFDRERQGLEQVEECMHLLTQRSWPRPVLEKFFHGWRDTHLTSGAVSAMMCRLMIAAANPAATIGRQGELMRAASETGFIIHEDLGLHGELHSELYNRLANAVCGGDQWQLLRNRVPDAHDFRRWVLRERTTAADLQDGINTTIASEIFNHGEYSFAAPIFSHWLTQHLGQTERDAHRNLGYIVVHTGDTESGHFLHGVNALRHYCAGMGVAIDPARIGNRTAEYLRRVGTAFKGISAILK